MASLAFERGSRSAMPAERRSSPFPNRRAVALVGLLLVVAALSGAGCRMQEDAPSAAQAAVMTQGDPERGAERIRTYGCDACHTIPGIPGADRTVGPPLTGMASRLYVAGMLPNNPDNLVRWIRDPPAVDSLTAMPNLGVSEVEARDIAAYLYTLD